VICAAFQLRFLQEIHLVSKQLREGKHFHSGFGPWKPARRVGFSFPSPSLPLFLPRPPPPCSLVLENFCGFPLAAECGRKNPDPAQVGRCRIRVQALVRPMGWELAPQSRARGACRTTPPASTFCTLHPLPCPNFGQASGSGAVPAEGPRRGDGGPAIAACLARGVCFRMLPNPRMEPNARGGFQGGGETRGTRTRPATTRGSHRLGRACFRERALN